MIMRARSVLTNLGLLLAALGSAGAAPAAAKPEVPVALPDNLLNRAVDWGLSFFQAEPGTNSAGRYAVAGLLFVAAILLRRAITHVIFAWLKRLAAKTASTLDDKLLPALETPVAWLVFVFLAFAGLEVLVLPPAVEVWIGHAFDVIWVTVIFWGLLRALNAVVDHLAERDTQRGLGLSHFVPLIKKTLAVVFIVMAALTVAQRLGIQVGAFIAGLGIGGLAFALAAQETIANFFGSLVVVMDRPFRVGEFVRIGTNLGMVEDIGLRSTKLRALDKSLIVIPNKTVAAETLTNLSRFTQRRVEQVIGLTYDTPAAQMEAVVEEIRQLLRREPEIDPSSVLVFFRDYGASSLDIWIVYVVRNPDFLQSMDLRQRMNLAIMRAVQARGLAFAFPSQTVYLDGEVAKRLAGLPAAQRS